jgi:hypothetical protein
VNDDLDYVVDIVGADVAQLRIAATHYGDSWKLRGGVGAFMMLARKWDRLERAVKRHQWDVFEAAADDQRSEGIIDDIRDLRRYLILVEAYLLAAGQARPEFVKSNAAPDLPLDSSESGEEMDV